MQKELADEWKERGIKKENDYAILTNEMTKAWSGLSVKEYKQLKVLKKENLRDNMKNIELVLNMLAEVTTTAISRQDSQKHLLKTNKLQNEVEMLQMTQKNELKWKQDKKLLVQSMRRTKTCLK